MSWHHGWELFGCLGWIKTHSGRIVIEVNKLLFTNYKDVQMLQSLVRWKARDQLQCDWSDNYHIHTN